MARKLIRFRVMSRAEVSQPSILQRAQAWASSNDHQLSSSAVLVWRIRLWLLALAIALLAGQNNTYGAQRLAGREAAKQTECSARTATPPLAKVD